MSVSWSAMVPVWMAQYMHSGDSVESIRRLTASESIWVYFRISCVGDRLSLCDKDLRELYRSYEFARRLLESVFGCLGQRLWSCFIELSFYTRTQNSETVCFVLSCATSTDRVKSTVRPYRSRT